MLLGAGDAQRVQVIVFALAFAVATGHHFLLNYK
jgi:hypothetical protein